MRVQPLIQAGLIDVADWEADAEFGVFPQGARAKDAVFAPDGHPETVLIPRRRYMFKRSKRSYPDQFWGEIIAYRVGCLMGLQVPPAFAAVNSQTGLCAALIEWFYTDSVELFMHGGDFITAIRRDFDRVKGQKHNLQDIEVLMRALAIQGALEKEWRTWWAKALLFDAMIGNTDRHQDNWGLVFQRAGMDEPIQISKCRLSPLFDNGTSLGHERFADRVNGWSDARLQQYVEQGTHHLKWSLVEGVPPLNGHLTLLRHVLATWPGIDIAELKNCLDFETDELPNCIADLAQLPASVALTPDRITFVLRLLTLRHRMLKELLDEPFAPPC
ncbi:MAG: HipA domain-containing protein [Burkholderiaceae bacterium]|nr:HipA domain-containing protein [Burkholderiaceae bacterium]